MGFLALILALLIEQLRPLRRGNRVHSMFTGFAALVRGNFDGGERRHGALGWLLVMAASVVAVLLAEWIAASLHPLFVFALHVFVLYCTIGFRQFSHAFTEIRVALAADDVGGARRVLTGWLAGSDPAEEAVADRAATVTATCRQAIAHALLAAHRHVLGPLFWYIVVPGAVGPVVYRVAEMLARRWRAPGPIATSAATERVDPGSRVDGAATEPLAGSRFDASPAELSYSSPSRDAPGAWGEFALLAFDVIDWIPVRLTAAGFAIVGNFEDATYCWRGVTAAGTGGDTRALLLAAGGGALGLRVADPALEQRWAEAGFEAPGVDPEPASLHAASGLVWRSVVLWIALFALITISAWMGR
jgi:cobalamin biosynthesis protein CobD/CbiB